MTRRSAFTARYWPLALSLLILLSPVCIHSRRHGAGGGARLAAMTGTGTLRNGAYAILCESSTRDSADVVTGPRVVLVYDRKYTDPAPETTPTYVALDTSLYVPLILEGAPQAERDATGRMLLGVTLARPYIKTLEDFTTMHLGGKVAIVLDGEVVTTHKVRSVIKEGKIQITRCSDNGCEVLRAKLTE